MGVGLTLKNQNVRELRRLLGRRSARLEAGSFVVEGPVLIREAVSAGWVVAAEFVAPGATPVSTGPRDSVFELAEGVIERIATTERPQPNLAVVRTPERRLSLEDASIVLVADRLADPGNFGTILRSAEASGVDAVVLTPGSVDPYNPKSVRASAGALFHVPVLEAEVDEVRSSGLRVVGTSSHLGRAHVDADWSGRIAIMVGNEAHGLPVDAPVDDWVRIEHRGRAESLNVAMAATVILFEAMQRRA
ncbi:MAG: hypothetical protein RLZZ01_967 [Actinomycetota bacterium]